MEYLLLIHVDPASYGSLDETAMKELVDAYWKFTDDAKASGVLVIGNDLYGTEKSSTVKIRYGQTIVTDGPFAETKEVLGGYYQINVASLEEAKAWAARIPDAVRGTIEIRPIFDHTRE